MFVVQTEHGKRGAEIMYIVQTERGYITTQNGPMDVVQDRDYADQYPDEYDAQRLAEVARLSQKFRNVEVIKI